MRAGSGKNGLQNMAVHIRQAEIAAGVAKGQLLVIKSEAVQHGGVQIMNTDRVFGGAEPEFVCRAVDGAAFDSTAGQPDAEAPVIMVAAGLWLSVGAEFDRWCPAKFAAPENEGVFKETALFEIGNECGDGLVDLGRERPVGGFDVGMIIPWLTGTMPQLNKPDAAFEQPAGDEGLSSVDAVSVEFVNVSGLAADVKCLCGIFLHAKGEFERLDSCVEAWIEPGVAMGCIELMEQVQLAALSGCCQLRVIDVLDQLADLFVAGIDVGSLKHPWQEC